MATKVMKYEIIKPLDATWEEFGSLLNSLRYDTRQILNKTIQLCWEWDNFSSDYKKINNEYPDKVEYLKYKTVNGYCYDKLKTEYTNLNTANLSISLKRAVDKFKADKKEVFIGDKSIANYKKNIPIDLHNKSIKITRELDIYCLNVSLISNTYKKELNRDKGQYKILINEGNKSSKDILKRCIDGTYKISASSLIKKDKKWYFYLSYTFENKQKQPDKNIRMGIDMGIVNAVYWGIHGTHLRGKIEGSEIDPFIKQINKRKNQSLKVYTEQINKRRNQLLKACKYAGDGKTGHGIKTKIKSIDFTRNKINNFRNTVNHRYSKYIIDYAVRNNVGTIILEQLAGITADNNYLKNWSYFDLQSKIEYKAKEKGIEVKKINAKYTSQRCNKCGFIDKENRETQSKFLCKECGYETLADYNASLNIATPDIEEIIKYYKDNSSLKIS